jgi:hypothetical protein
VKSLSRAVDAKLNERGCSDKRMSDLDHIFRSSPWALSPTRRMVESWDLHVMPLIVSQFSFPRPGGGRIYGSLECIHRLLHNVETDSTLYLAAHAVGYAYLANKMPSSSLILSHQLRCGRALQALRVSLLDPVLQKQDLSLGLSQRSSQIILASQKRFRGRFAAWSCEFGNS